MLAHRSSPGTVRTARTLVSRPAALVIPPNPCAAEAAPVPPNGCRPLSLTAVSATAVRVLLHNGVGEDLSVLGGKRMPRCSPRFLRSRHELPLRRHPVMGARSWAFRTWAGVGVRAARLDRGRAGFGPFGGIRVVVGFPVGRSAVARLDIAAAASPAIIRAGTRGCGAGAGSRRRNRQLRRGRPLGAGSACAVRPIRAGHRPVRQR